MIPGNFILRQWPSGRWLQIILPVRGPVWTEDRDEALPHDHADAVKTAASLGEDVEVVRQSDP